MSLNRRQRLTLEAVRVESDFAQAVGNTTFRKGQLGAGIGWTTLHQLADLGLVEIWGRGDDRMISITEAGRAHLM